MVQNPALESMTTESVCVVHMVWSLSYGCFITRVATGKISDVAALERLLPAVVLLQLLVAQCHRSRVHNKKKACVLLAS